MVSVTTLAGIGLNALFGWWWADPVAALAMTWFIGDGGARSLAGRGVRVLETTASVDADALTLLVVLRKPGAFEELRVLAEHGQVPRSDVPHGARACPPHRTSRTHPNSSKNGSWI